MTLINPSCGHKDILVGNSFFFFREPLSPNNKKQNFVSLESLIPNHLHLWLFSTGVWSFWVTLNTTPTDTPKQQDGECGLILICWWSEIPYSLWSVSVCGRWVTSSGSSWSFASTVQEPFKSRSRFWRGHRVLWGVWLHFPYRVEMCHSAGMCANVFGLVMGSVLRRLGIKDVSEDNRGCWGRGCSSVIVLSIQGGYGKLGRQQQRKRDNVWLFSVNYS